MNKIFCIIGKTSSGKNRLYQELLSDESLHLKPNVMYTTRPIRENEQEGKDYHFVNQIFFEKAKEENRVVESRNYETVYGPWTYFTLADEFDLENYDYLVINTLEGYQSLKKVYGNKVVPLYLYVDDFLRLERALYREKQEKKPKLKELCRRFLADEIDFSEEKLRESQIPRENYFENISFIECSKKVKQKIQEQQQEKVKKKI